MKHIESDIAAVEKEMDDDAEAIITNERYLAIADMIKACYKKKNVGGSTVSDKIDRIVDARHRGDPEQGRLLQRGFFYQIGITEHGRTGLVGDDPSVGEDDRTVGVFQHQMHVVGDHDDRDALSVEFPQEFHDVGVVAEVLTGGRFV